MVDPERNVCIEMMDAAAIDRFMPLSRLRTIFGPAFRENWDVAKDGSGYAMLFFKPIEVSSDSLSSPIATGWFLLVRYDADETVVEFSISNCRGK